MRAFFRDDNKVLPLLLLLLLRLLQSLLMSDTFSARGVPCLAERVVRQQTAADAMEVG